MTRAYLTAKRPNKYHARAVVRDGIRFGSQREARRYAELELLQKAGRISELKPHPAFQLHVALKDVAGGLTAIPVGKYTADSQYYDEMGVFVIEDVKSPATRKSEAYRLRKRMVEAQYGITITEVF